MLRVVTEKTGPGWNLGSADWPQGRCVFNGNVRVRNLVDRMVVATKQIVFCLVTSLMIGGLSNDQKRVEEIRIVVAVVDGCLVGGFITGAEGSEAINVMRMPVPEVLDLRMKLFNRSKNAFLIFAVLEQARRRPLCIRRGR